MNKSRYYNFFTNLANPLKINIILALKTGNKSVSELCESLKVEQSKISHALSCLKGCRIVNSKQEGKQRIYSLNQKTIVPMLKILDEHSKSFCKCKECKGCKG